MKCLECSAEMRLTDVRHDRTTVCGIERHTFRCSACTHTAQRLTLNRSRVPITYLPVVIPPKAPVIDPHNGRPAAQSAWAKSIEKVNNKQAELKQRAAATTDWGSVVEKLSTALKQQAGAARAEALARVVEKVRGRQTGLLRYTSIMSNQSWLMVTALAKSPVVLGDVVSDRWRRVRLGRGCR